jgi:hypothetical protein
MSEASARRHSKPTRSAPSACLQNPGNSSRADVPITPCTLSARFLTREKRAMRRVRVRGKLTNLLASALIKDHR